MDRGSICKYFVTVKDSDLVSLLNKKRSDPVTGPEWPRGWVELELYSFESSALEGGEWSASRPGLNLPPGKTRYPLYERLGGPQSRSGEVRKISPPTGIRSPDRLPVVSRYTDWATGPTSLLSGVTNFCISMFQIKLFSIKILQYTLLVKTCASQLCICLSGLLYRLTICARLAFGS
jgi:hypothetical protein